MRDIPEWVKSIPRHKLNEAITDIVEMATIAEKNMPKQNAPNINAPMRENIAYRRGIVTGLSNAISAFKKHTMMVKKQS